VSRNFGEEGRRLNYGSYLKVPELLSLQQGLTKAHDELLFIAVHQAYELWFKVILHELEAARDALFAGDDHRARHCLRRVQVIERLLVDQVDVLETMSPQDFMDFRSELAPASGFQSIQFREIEFVSGLKNPAYLARLEANSEERSRLERRLAEPTLWNAYEALLERDGVSSLVEVASRSGSNSRLWDVAESLLDHDEAFAHWRSRHVLMVERQIGGKTGTGGSGGAAYLKTTLDKRFFPALWELRNTL
jgi:tryptophan 2,3-dioxygenase